MEMYFPPFEGAIKAGVLSVMCANNLVNGVYVCENNHTTNHILREYGGFKGWMCSDYRGTRSTIDAANNGLDIAMPGPPSRPDYFGVPLEAAIQAGRVSEAVITEKVVRIVYSLAVVGALDAENNNSSQRMSRPTSIALLRVTFQPVRRSYFKTREQCFR
jgi:beta-glucosidase